MARAPTQVSRARAGGAHRHRRDDLHCESARCCGVCSNNMYMDMDIYCYGHSVQTRACAVRGVRGAQSCCMDHLSCLVDSSCSRQRGCHRAARSRSRSTRVRHSPRRRHSSPAASKRRSHAQSACDSSSGANAQRRVRSSQHEGKGASGMRARALRRALRPCRLIRRRP